MIRLPKRLNSRAPSAAWLNQLRDCVEAMRQSRTDSTHTDETVRGTFIRAGRGKKASIPLKWRGEYSASSTYAVGDVVIYGSETSPTDTDFLTLLLNGTLCGTYILMRLKADGTQPDAPSEPNGFNPSDLPYWQTFSRGAWPVLTITKEAVADPLESGCIVLDADLCKSAAPALTFKKLYPQEIEVCVGGVSKRVMAIVSDPYTAGT